MLVEMRWAHQAVVLARCAAQMCREGEGVGPGGPGAEEMWGAAGRLAWAALRPPGLGRHGLQMWRLGGREVGREAGGRRELSSC